MNVYRLKFSVLVKDPDLVALRASPLWGDLASQLAGGTSVGAGGAASVRLRAEAKSPFRALRLFFLGALGGGSGLGTFITVPALIKSVTHAPGAAELLPTVGNLAVDLGVGVACVYFFTRELKAKEAQEAVTAREEALGALRVALSADGSRTAQLTQLRGAYRPLVLTGGRAALRAATRAAEPYKRELQARGVLLVLLEDDAPEEGAKPKPKGFGSAVAGAAPELTDAAEAASATEARWKAPPLDATSWRAWAAAQREQASLPAGAPIYVAVALDGTVSRSGPGAPKWCVARVCMSGRARICLTRARSSLGHRDELVADTNPVDSNLTKLTGY